MDKVSHFLHLVHMMPVENLSVHLYRYRKDVSWRRPRWFICVGSGLSWWGGNVQLYVAVQQTGDFDALLGENLLWDCKLFALMGLSPVLQRSTTEDNQHGGEQAVPWEEPFWHCKPLNSTPRQCYNAALRRTSLWVPGWWSPQMLGIHDTYLHEAATSGVGETKRRFFVQALAW